MQSKYENASRTLAPTSAIAYGHPWCFPIVCPRNMGHLRVSGHICIENWYVYRYLIARHRPPPYKPHTNLKPGHGAIRSPPLVIAYLGILSLYGCMCHTQVVPEATESATRSKGDTIKRTRVLYQYTPS